MVDFKSVKNIIFDFGAVVINIDIPAAYRAFAKLANKDAEDVRILFENQGAYAEYEAGKMSDADFRNLVRRELNIKNTDQEIDEAWNAMLLDIPAERVEKLKELRSRYKIYMLSNTNAIHIKKMKEMFYQQFALEDFTNLFHKPYLSYQIGLIKPDPAIYEYIMKDADLKNEETIFLDDNPDNVKSALSTGLPTIRIIPGSVTMMDVLKDA